MRIPDSLISLVDEGLIDEVLRPLMSGKEAQIYLLRAAGELRVAKVYKQSQDRTFKHRAEYTEGRKVRNSRDQRAMAKLSRYGREQEEAAWRATEVDMIHRLRAAGVRVPTPYQFIDGVLIMELICDEAGDPAPRLGDVRLERAHAEQIYEQLLREVVRMLCAGVVHGDLSDFNVLLAPDGPVIIDFPQAVNAASSQNARKLLLRDVENLQRFLARFAPERRRIPYAEEMWQLYQNGELTHDAKLSGRYRAAEGRVDTDGVLTAIADAAADEHRRRARLGQSLRGPAHPAGGRERNVAALQPERPARLQSSHTRDRGRHASVGGQQSPQPTRRTSGPPGVQPRRGPANPKQPPFPHHRSADAANTTRNAADAANTRPRKRRRRRKPKRA
jgi:RIO kinase 1